MARTCTTAERDIIRGVGVNHLQKTMVADADGVLRDTRSLGSFSLDMLVGSQWGEDVDNGISQLTFYLRRDDSRGDTLAPTMNVGSTINRNALAAYAPFLEKGRLVVHYTATVLQGAAPLSTDWKEMWRGRIDRVQWHADPVTVICSDMGAWIMDAFIRDPKTYASTSTIVGGGILLGDVIQSMLDDSVNCPVFTAPISLYQPVVSDFQPIGPSPQNPDYLMTAIRTLAQEIGWECRYRYDALDNYRLTLYEPARDNTIPDWVIGPSEYTDVTNLETNLANIRTVIRGIYIDALGMTQKVTVPAGETSAQINKYGKRFMGIPSATIRDAANMLALITAVLSDLSEADADQEIVMPYFWPVQIGDLMLFRANHVHYDADQLLAVVSFQHSFANGEGTTTLRVRGKVSGSPMAWLDRAANTVEAGANDPIRSITHINRNESADGTLSEFELTVGSLVNMVMVHFRTVDITEPEDAWDFSSTAVLPEDPDSPRGPLFPLGGTVAFTLPQPQRGLKVAARFIPYYTTGGVPVEGPSEEYTINAAPPAINADTHASKVGATANLNIPITFGPSDGPVGVKVVQNTLGVSTTILNLILNVPETLDSSVYTALAGIPIPANADSISWTVYITDVSGNIWTFGPTYALPSVVLASPVITEAAGVSTITLTVDDPSSYLNPAAVDGGVTAPISWHVIALGSSTTHASTTHPGVGTSGVYTFVVTQDPLHTTQVIGYLHCVDGSVVVVGPFTFDNTKVSQLASGSSVSNGANATVTLNWNTDTTIGSGDAQYSLDAGVTWNAVSVTSSYVSQFSIARTSSKQTVLVQGKNVLDGAWGVASTVEVDAFLTEGPTMTVTPTPGPTSYSIAWSGTGTITLSIDGASFGTPSASPIVVTRDGSNHTYAFKAVAGGQTFTDTITVPSLAGSGSAVTPDLSVAPGTSTSTTQPFTATTVDPTGATTPSLTVTCTGCTMTIAGTTYPDGTTRTITTGTVVTANRPVSTTTTQASLEFLSAITGGGQEDIVVTVLAQLNLGPTLTVTPTPGGTTYSIAWSGTGTITLSIDGGSDATPSASPISVTRPAAGSNFTHYRFKAIADGQTLTDEVTVPAIDANTVTPNLTVVPGTPTATTQPYTVTATNPSGGTAPTMSATCNGCTMTISGTTYPDGTTQTITTGTVVTANRNVSTTTTQAHVKFDATISGGGTEEIVVEVTPQLNLGPTLSANPTPGPTTYSIAWTGTGTITLSIDGGSFSTPGTSPIVVSRDGSDHTYTFKAIADGQEIRQTVGVPALPASATVTGTVSSLTNVLHSGGGPPGAGAPAVIRFGWAWSGSASVQFEVWYMDTVGNGDSVFRFLHLTAAGATFDDYTTSEDISSSITPFTTIGFFLKPYLSGSYGTPSSTLDQNYGSP